MNLNFFMPTKILIGYSLTYFKEMPHGNVCLYKEFLVVFKERSRVNNIHKMLGLIMMIL